MIGMSLSLCAMDRDAEQSEVSDVQILAEVLGTNEEGINKSMIKVPCILGEVLADQEDYRGRYEIWNFYLEDVFEDRANIEKAVKYFKGNDTIEGYFLNIRGLASNNVAILVSQEEKKLSTYGWRIVRSFLQGSSGLLIAVLGVKSFFDKGDNKYLGASAISAGSLCVGFAAKDLRKNIIKGAKTDRKYRTYCEWLDTLSDIKVVDNENK